MALPIIMPGDSLRAVTYAKSLERRALLRAGNEAAAAAINLKTRVYGQAAVAGIKILQKRYGLKPDGIIGPNTWAMLRKHGSAVPQRTYYIRARRNWRAQRPLDAPVKTTWDKSTTFFLHHTVTKSPSNGVAGEEAAMRELQRIALARGFSDISYSYVVFPSGNIYEGRGKEVIGAHTLGYNKHVGTALCGNYETQKVTKAQEEAINWLRKKLGVGDMKPHSDVYATACPGKNAVKTFGL